MPGKLIIITAPSGAGKTTIARHLLVHYPMLLFSVSATTRPRRADEVHGKDYYFITEEKFKERIALGEFIEWEEVYQGLYYGTLENEVEGIWQSGKDVLFDVDVKGAVSLKKKYGENALTIFIKPFSFEALEERLRGRATESEEKIEERIAKAKQEMEYEQYFDATVVNHDLPQALEDAEKIVDGFLFATPNGKR